MFLWSIAIYELLYYWVQEIQIKNWSRDRRLSWWTYNEKGVSEDNFAVIITPFFITIFLSLSFVKLNNSYFLLQHHITMIACSTRIHLWGGRAIYTSSTLRKSLYFSKTPGWGKMTPCLPKRFDFEAIWYPSNSNPIWHFPEPH